MSESPDTAQPGALEPDDIIAIAPHFRLQWEEAQKAYVLLYPEGMVQLSETAGEILTHCTGKTSLGGIIQEMQTLYPDDDIANDVRSFFQQAAANGWVRAEPNE